PPLAAPMAAPAPGSPAAAPIAAPAAAPSNPPTAPPIAVSLAVPPEAWRASLTDLVRQLKTIRPQEVAAGPTAEALARARSEAVREVSTAKQVAAGSPDQVKRAGQGAARAVIVGFV